MKRMTKTILMVLAPALLGAAELPQPQQMFDGKLSQAQRANVCFALRGNTDGEVIRAMAQAMENPSLIACAAENLRIAHAVDALKQGLHSSTEQTRAAAARALGSFQDVALLEDLNATAHDPNMLVATNGLGALANYEDHAALPYLGALAAKGGMIGDMALERILQLDPALAVSIARRLIKSDQVPDKLYAMRTMGAAGDRSDLSQLTPIAATKEEAPMLPSRGFGFMPPINLSRAAQSAISQIETRTRE
jgi:HEAT repeats